jgi:enolase
MDDRIRDVRGFEILDSRGNPTLGVRVTLQDGTEGWARVPAGASTGVHEARELRDGGARYGGKGVRSAVANVDGVVGPAVTGRHASDQRGLDDTLVHLDGSEQKENLGANTLLGVSLAVSAAAANALQIPLYRYWGGSQALTLPVPQLNVLNGGAHADNNVDLQEFMLLPVGAETFQEAMRMAAETYHALKARLHKAGLRTAVGDEGGFAPDLDSDEEALDLLVAAIGDAGLKAGEDVALGVDAAVSALYRDGRYVLRGRTLSAEEMVDWYEKLVAAYPILSLEDGLAEDDWEGWQMLNQRLGDRLQLVGDDIFVTNPKRLERGIREHSANAILIKLNQIGTVSETLDTIQMATRAGWRSVVSHRSGETEDTMIADFVCATNAGQLKSGAPARSDRVAKYNRLLIMEQNDPGLVYAGRKALSR